MGRKIFVSYKYADSNIYSNNGQYSTVRDYVTYFENVLDISDHIYKGEEDGTDLSSLKDSTIETKLKERIFDSSVTVVFISPNMKDMILPETDQWIPWEISYSLKHKKIRLTNSNKYKYSNPNGLVAVVLPDRNNSYEYFWHNESCCNVRCNYYDFSVTFEIIKNNFFNKINPRFAACPNAIEVYGEDDSYITLSKWDYFIKNYDYFIDKAAQKSLNFEDYEVVIDVG